MTVRPCVLYDWDNTLVDGWAGITAALNAVFDAFAMPAWSVADTRARVRVSLRDSFPVMFGSRMGTRPRHLLRHTGGAASAPRHADAGRGRGVGGRRVLAAGGGVEQGRTVSARRGDASRLVRAFRHRDRRRRCRCRQAGSAPILLALDRLGQAAGRSVWYLGDTALDMAAARAAGVTAVLVGDASHDGGIDRARPDLHFPTALDLAARLRALAREAC